MKLGATKQLHEKHKLNNSIYKSKVMFYCSKLQSFGEFVTSHLLSLTMKYLVPAKLSPSSTMTSRLNGRITMWVP